MSNYYGKVRYLNNMGKDEIADKIWQAKYPNKPIDRNNYDYKFFTRNSIPIINKLYEAGLGDLDVIFEYPTPFYSFIRMMLVGFDTDGNSQVMLIERIRLSDRDENRAFKTIENGKKIIMSYKDDPEGTTEKSQKLRPMYNAFYRLTKQKNKLNNNTAFNGTSKKDENVKIRVLLLAPFLRNINILLGNSDSNLFKQSGDDTNKVIGKYDENAVNYLKATFNNQNNSKLTKKIVNGEFVGEKESVSFNGLRQAVKGNEAKSVLDFKKEVYKFTDQRSIEEDIENQIRGQILQPQKKLIIISGAAGTGKTYLGFRSIYYYHSIMQEFGLSNDNPNDAIYCLVKNRTLARVISEDNDMRIRYVNQVIENKSIKPKLMVIDEAHRMGNINDDLDKLFNKGINTIILLQDDWQVLRLSEKGTLKNFEEYVKNHSNVNLKKYKLTEQMRCGIRSNIIDIIDNMFKDDKVYADPFKVNIKIYDELKKLDEQMKDYKSRPEFYKHPNVKWLAPCCWPWNSSQNEDDKVINFNSLDSHDDFHFEHPWQQYDTEKQYQWLKNKDNTKYVGSVYAIQGLGLDYVGLIWWNDLKWDLRANKWIYDLTRSRDTVFLNLIKDKFGNDIDKLNAEQHPEILQLYFNIYAVLLTRATGQTNIWFRDEDTRDKVREYLSPKES